MSDENDDYELEVVDEYDDSDVSQQMTSIDSGARIGDTKESIYAYIGPEDIKDPEGKLKVIIPNLYRNSTDEDIVKALDNIVFSQRYNPFLLNFKQLQASTNEKYKKRYESLNIPKNVYNLFLQYKEKIQRPEDISNDMDDSKSPELYASSDYKLNFGILDLSDKRDVDFVLNNMIPYLLIKIYMKKNYIVLRLMTDVKFGIVEDETYGKSIAPISYSTFIEFEPVKNKKKRGKK